MTALYTNIDIIGCITNIIEFANEHISDLDTFGLNLTEIHEILELVLTSSWFTFDNYMYKQLIGLFMGCIPSPLCAIVRVYTFERNSIYTDVYYLNSSVKLFYGRYVDDSGSLAKTKKDALSILQHIANQDPDHRLKWEIDYPETSDTFIPFLDTEIRINDSGIVHYRYYRKPNKKNITLHALSHHPQSTKVNTIKNFYNTAATCSSTSEYTEQSKQKIDHVLRCNGYSNPRSNENTRIKSFNKPNNHEKCVYMKIPYLSENISRSITQFVNSHNLPIKVIFTPGTKLFNLLCSSRPYDKPKCRLSNCNICPCLVNFDCSVKCPIYKITCNLCDDIYIGESCRSAGERLSEHLRFASNPNSKSYQNEALAIHYRLKHQNCNPNLSFEILKTERNTLRRKITEASYILNLQPKLNDKEECKMLDRFLVK